MIRYYKRNLPEIPAGYESNGLYGNRTFQDLNGVISGKSVVIDKESRSIDSDMWPYNLSEYLKGFIGKSVRVEYVLPNNRCYEKRGVLKVAGTDFIGIQPFQTNSLFLLELSSIKSINIINYQNDSHTRKTQFSKLN